MSEAGPIASITPAYALALGLIAGYWLLRVAWAARRRLTPHMAWWAVPGVALLWATPLTEADALFGLGAAMLLFAEFWPLAYRPARARPGWAWPTVGVVFGLAALSLAALHGSGGLSLALALTSSLAGLGGLLSAALFSLPAARRAPGLELRFAPVQLPEWPDLSVTVTERGAQLQNVSGQALWLAGWSPADLNAWLPVRTENGRRLNTLDRGQSAFLPLGEQHSGVRVWYVPARTPEQARLFRADWTPQRYAGTRVLN
ncbi:hypothetical protein [Deinococcus hopiensis]|uniref:Uncharacterized protein n=1 Tax=Deinococcus hopiensis KR-140 TaxID=695939 RepID=A0A1W1VD93_9DEIO|nr:hypothetical protein [Deinococcus hopiensis]SMB91342.1 hypothetical protein SAMN00790413_01100 [Deinococcus hopiensis KR-140]